MTYLEQVITVTRWEYSRFFKPRNEIIGLVIMLIVSSVFYLGGKYAFSDTDKRYDVSVMNDTDSLLTAMLQSDFNVKKISGSMKRGFIENISNERETILLDQEENTFIIYAYKHTRAVKKLKTCVSEYHKQREMQKIGLSHDQLSSILSSAPVKESFVNPDNSNNRIVVAFILAGLMLLAVFLSFAYQFTAITGEKQLKITEQIVSAISPQVWMDGKIFGIALTGISSMVTYSLLGIVGGFLFLQFSGKPVSTVLDYIHLPSLLLFFPYAITGILIWNAILAAVASIITDPNNSGKSSLMMLPLLFVIASLLVTRDPDSGLSIFLSWFPLTSATSMPIRWALSEVEYWQLAGSFAILIFTFYFLRRLASVIFRVSILITGKEPTWSEVFRMIKKA